MSTCLLDWAIATAGGSRASSGSPLRCILILWRPTHRSSVQASTTIPVPDPASSCSSANFVLVHSSCTLRAIDHPNRGIFRNSNYKMPSCRTTHLFPFRSVLIERPAYVYQRMSRRGLRWKCYASASEVRMKLQKRVGQNWARWDKERRL